MDHNTHLCKGMNRKLYKAVECGDAKSLGKVLEEEKVNVFEEVTPTGDTALHTAAFYGHAKLASKLIERASENPEAGMQFLKAQNTDGNTALHAAAEGGCEKTVKLLVEKDGHLACVKNKRGETALFKASENGHVGIVKQLLDCTPESEEVDSRADGQTPLHVAVAKLHTGVTAKLLDKRSALVYKASVSERTALHILALVPKPIGTWSTSTKANVRKIGKMLLDKEISLLYRVDANGQSALHLAAKLGNAPLVEVILSYGTDCLYISDKEGRTALHLVVENASQVYARVGPALRYIISSLALRRLINCSDNIGQTGLDIAIQKAKEDTRLFLGITTYLRRHGASEKMFESETRDDSASSSLLKPNWRMEIISINAVLIATVAFAAAFTLPGNIDSAAKPILLHVPLFKFFVVFDSLAFCSSVGSAVLLYYALGNQEEDHVLIAICFGGLWVALTCIALAFGAAIHLLVAPKCLWLAVLVWIMVCCLPIQIRLLSMLGKVHLFTEATQLMVEFIRPLVVKFVLPIGLLMIPIVFGFGPLFGFFFLVAGIILGWLGRRRLVLILSWSRERLARIFQ